MQLGLAVLGAVDCPQLAGDLIIPFLVDTEHGKGTPESHGNCIECVVACVLRVVGHCFDYEASSPSALQYLQSIMFYLLLDDLTSDSDHDSEIEPLNFQWILCEILIFTCHTKYCL